MSWTAGLSMAMLVMPSTLLAQEDSTSFIAVADTYVRSTSPDNGTNYGDKTTFYVRNSISAYQQLGLIRFDASSFDLPANIQLDSAKVFMTTGDVLNAAINVSLIKVSDDNWDESTITWDSYKLNGPDTIATIANTHVSAKHARYSWDVTGYIREELMSGNKIISLAVFQDHNTSANTTFVTKESVTGDEAKPLLALFTHAVPVKVVSLMPSLDRGAGAIALQWMTPAEYNTSYALVERSTDGANFATISGQLAAQGNKSDSTSYSYTDNSAVEGYTNYYRIKYVMADNSTYFSDVVSVPYFVQVATLEDSYVQLAGNGSNHGAENKLLVKNDGNSSYSRIAFLKFDLSGLAGTPQAGSLHLTINTANSSVGSVTWYLWHIMDDSWTEAGITGKNYPDMSDSTNIINSQPGRSTGSVDFTIPVSIIREATNADGILSLAITSNNVSTTDDVSFVSKDSANLDVQPVLMISEDPTDNATPVTMSKLKAAGDNKGVHLSWKAFTELNTKDFVIERSQDGHQFSAIGHVKARGTATTTKLYTYQDINPNLGINFYRLKSLDLNGNTSYSNIASLNWGKAGQAAATWKIYPNPAQRGQTLHIALEAGQKAYTLRILDANGRLLKVQKVAQTANLQLSTAGLATGIYYIQLLSDKGQMMGKVHRILIK